MFMVEETNSNDIQGLSQNNVDYCKKGHRMPSIGDVEYLVV